MLRKRKVPAIKWVEPQRNGGPGMTAEAVAKELGFSVTRVHQLAEDGPEKDGLAGYINLASGWTRKYGRGFPGVQVFFYQDDIADWKRRHPFKKLDRQVHFTQEERNIVLNEAEAVKLPDGSVNRSRVMERLQFVPGTYNKERKKGIPRTEPGYGPRIWNSRTYKKVKAILDEAGVPRSPDQPKDTSTRRIFNIRRTA